MLSRKAEEEIDVNYSIFRPIGSLNITVSKGKNIRSRETGLAGNVGCRVYWDPVRYSSEKQKENIKSIDKSTSSVHDIGSTVSKFTTNPTWNQFNESDESRRLKQVLPHHGHFFETEAELAEESGSEFPVLQPFRKLEDEDESEETPQHINAVLEPWTASPGAVVFQVRFRDILNMLPGSDHIFGEVSIPLSTLVEQGEMSGWFQVLEVGTKNLVPIDQALAPTAPQVIDDTSVVDGLTEAALSNTDVPQIFLTVKWSAPETKFNTQEAEETQREASLVIQEELLRWAVIHKKKDFKQHVVGTIDAFSDVGSYVGTLQMIQNYLGTAADMLEAARNLLNFTVCLDLQVVVSVSFPVSSNILHLLRIVTPLH